MAAIAPASVAWRERLKDAALAAAVAAALAVPLIGFHAFDQPTGIRIETRFDWVAIGVVVVFIGRLLLAGVGRLRLPARLREIELPRVRMGPLANALIWLGLGFAIALPFLPFS